MKLADCKVGDTVYIIGNKCIAGQVSIEECSKINDCNQCCKYKEKAVYWQIVTQSFLNVLNKKINSELIWNKTVFMNETQANKVLNYIKKRGKKKC